MIEFHPYESKPVTRFAFQITAEHSIVKHAEDESTYVIWDDDEQPETINYVHFKAYEEPKVGDWVVRLTESDTYHCTDAVFRERNVVPE